MYWYYPPNHDQLYDSLWGRSEWIYSVPSLWKRPDGTVDGSEIPNNHLGCMKPCKWDKLPFPQLVQDFFHQQYAWVQTLLLAALFFENLGKVSSEAYPQKETSWLFFYVDNHISQINQTLQLKKKTTARLSDLLMKIKPFRLVIFHQSHQKKAKNPPPSAGGNLGGIVVDGHVEAIGGIFFSSSSFSY